MTETNQLTAATREIADDEVAFYQENGWVKLDRLIDPAFAAELRTAAEALFAKAAAKAAESVGMAAPTRGGGNVVDIGFWRDYHYAARDDRVEPFVSFVFSKELGRAAQQLIDRDVPVQYHSDIVACKMPATAEEGSGPTSWHQDASLPFDRVGSLAFWVALNEIPPERGAMRFLSGSQREGSLGRHLHQKTDLLDVFPKLRDRYELSPALHLQPGDATVHNSFVAHSAPVNSTDEPRWAYICAYYPGDALYTGAQNNNFDGLGLEPNKRIEHPRFPVVYP